MLNKKIISGIFFLTAFLSQSVKTQELANCQKASPITIDLVGNIVPYTTQSHFTINSKQEFVLFKPEIPQTNSFWYKIDVLENTELSMTIKPLGTNDLYNFFVYKDLKDGAFCEHIEAREILPIRSNLVKDSTGKAGTGLAHQNIKNENDTNYLYHTAFHAPIQAKMNDTYYINVYHTKGSDCGHSLSLQTNNNQQTFVTVGETCYTDSVFKTPSFIPIIDEKLAKLVVSSEKKFSNTLIIKAIVKDSVQQNAIMADIIEIKKDKIQSLQDTTTNELGECLLFLEGKIIYELEFSALGYVPKKIKWMKQTRQNELRDLGSIYLSPLKVGDRFVLKDIYFHAGTYAILQESEESLRKLLRFMQKNEQARIEIQGHTNGKGKVKRKADTSHLGPEWNFKGNEKKLSKLRAQAVKNYLIQNGISESRIQSVGFGSKKMLYSKPKNKVENDLNKRVEVVLIK
jgi:outer membrane protein OmpA-like peptidoglycan-associated protein